jgi:arsenate reductase
VVRYLETGVVEEDLPLLARLDGIVRKKEAGATVMASLQNQEDIMALLRTNPKVLERPVLISGQRAVIGRPPEDVLSLLHEA